jgi:hypothetical protein
MAANYRQPGHSRVRDGDLPDTAAPDQRLQGRDDVETQRDDAAESTGFYWVKTQFSAHSVHVKETAQEYADHASPNMRTVVTVAHSEHICYRNETARRTAAMVNIPGAVYGTHQINALTERYCVYANALMVLTNSPVFPDVHGIAATRPEHFQRREPW